MSFETVFDILKVADGKIYQQAGVPHVYTLTSL